VKARAIPRLSVVVPARNAASTLPQVLGALRASRFPAAEWELIVVDDGSFDETGDIAARQADVVVSLQGGPHGPAYARNRGADRARGDILVFVDADVTVHDDVLERFSHHFDAGPEPGPDAVFGAYDDRPPASGVVSQYRNLVHHWVHVRHAGEAETFWAGCGAVSRSAFGHVGGFDAARYPRPQIEDIDLGHRLRAAGFRIVLDASIQGTHLKRWTLGGGLITDVRDRGVPWAELLLEARGGARMSALNLHPAEKVATGLTGLGVALLPTAALTGDARVAAVGIAALLIALLPSLPLFTWLARRRGAAMALSAVPLRMLYYGANGLSVIVAFARVLRGRLSAERGRPAVPAADRTGIEG
jgi:hypothetical protein